MRDGLANVESPRVRYAEARTRNGELERCHDQPRTENGGPDPEPRAEPRTLNRTMKVNTNRERRSQKGERQLALRRPEIRHGQLQIALAIPHTVLERERQVDGGTMLCNEAFALGGAPGHAPKDAAVLFERHLEVTVLQTSRPLHDF